MPIHDTTSNGNSPVNDIRVGVIIPCYNRAHQIGAAIDSITKQQYPNIILVIINDGSNDNLEAVVRSRLTDIKTEKLEDQEVYVMGTIDGIPTIFISHEKHEGISTSKNKGILALWQTVKYLTILHADNFFLPEKIKMCVDIAESDQHIGIVYHDSILYDDSDSVSTNYRLFYQPYDRENLEKVNGMQIPSDYLVSKSAIEAAGLYDHNLTSYEDWDLWLRVTEKCAAVHISQVLSYNHTDSQSRTLSEKDKQIIIQRIIDRSKNA